MTQDLEILMERDGHRFSTEGGVKKCCCPFHREKSPSFVLYRDGHFHCFGCSAHGDIIGYVMRRDSIPYREALERLNISKPAPFRPVRSVDTQLLVHGDAMIARWIRGTRGLMLAGLAEQLGVSIHGLKALLACWAEEYKAWAFPMRNRFKQIVGIRLRRNNGEKFSVRGGHEGLFIPIGDMGTRLFIVEGPTDCAAGVSMGLWCIGRPNCTGAVTETVRYIRNTKPEHVVIVSDNDTPGLNGSDRLKSEIKGVRVTEIVLPCKDMREFCRAGGTVATLDVLIDNAACQTR